MVEDDNDVGEGGMTPSHKRSVETAIINNMRTSSHHNVNDRDKCNSTKICTQQTTSLSHSAVFGNQNATSDSEALSLDEVARLSYNSNSGFNSEDNDPFDNELLRSLNLIPIKEMKLGSTGTSGSHGAFTNPSVSSELNSEMDYVVQKIAALAQAASFDSTDSNANIKYISGSNNGIE